MCDRPCPQCPWRESNHGKRHKRGFYTKANLTRLWNGIRRGVMAQSCHLTDPGHPDHLEAGAKEGMTPKECPGSVILILRELEKIQEIARADGEEVIDVPHIERYLSENPRGITREGIMFWLIERIQFAGVPMIGGKPLPKVDVSEPGISAGAAA